MFLWLFLLDARVEHLPFTGSPIPIIGLIVSYIYFVTVWGPKYMKPRKAYDLKGVIKIYNLIQIATNLYIGIYVSVCCFWHSPTFKFFHIFRSYIICFCHHYHLHKWKVHFILLITIFFFFSYFHSNAYLWNHKLLNWHFLLSFRLLLFNVFLR